MVMLVCLFCLSLSVFCLLPLCLSASLPLCLSASLPLCLSVYLSVYLSVCQSVRLSVRPAVRPSGRPCVCVCGLYVRCVVCADRTGEAAQHGPTKNKCNSQAQQCAPNSVQEAHLRTPSQSNACLSLFLNILPKWVPTSGWQYQCSGLIGFSMPSNVVTSSVLRSLHCWSWPQQVSNWKACPRYPCLAVSLALP